MKIAPGRIDHIARVAAAMAYIRLANKLIAANAPIIIGNLRDYKEVYIMAQEKLQDLVKVCEIEQRQLLQGTKENYG